ncbi:glycerol-3-phosphate acyltransferase [Deinococcus radiophilus]|uniref:glycerol-3-phosphate acyltransferase n=1 Tax=Deinococcus radiophilus TaxID=32062 RepID=UPI003615CA10
MGVGVAVMDGLRGALAVWLAYALMPQYPELGAALAAFFVVLGHCYPVFFGFRGWRYRHADRGTGGGCAAGLLGAVLAAAVMMPLYKLILQKYVGLNVVPVVAGLAVPVALWLAATQGGCGLR